MISAASAMIEPTSRRRGTGCVGLVIVLANEKGLDKELNRTLDCLPKSPKRG
jgi:hypothetical protein